MKLGDIVEYQQNQQTVRGIIVDVCLPASIEVERIPSLKTYPRRTVTNPLTRCTVVPQTKE